MEKTKNRDLLPGTSVAARRHQPKGTAGKGSSVSRKEKIWSRALRVFYDLSLDTGQGRIIGPIKRIAGYELQELASDRDFRKSLIHPDDEAKIRTLLDRAMAEKTPYALEYRIVRKDGTMAYVEDTGFFLDDPVGDTARVVGTLKDTSEYRAAEARSRETGEKYRILIDGIRRTRDAVFILDRDGRFIFANNEIARRMGYDPDWMIGRCGFDIAPPEARETFRVCHEAAVNGEATTTYRYPQTSGGSLWAEVSSTVLRRGKTVVGSLGISRDISDRKRMEEALQESELKFRNLAEKSPVGIFLLQDGIFKYANQRMAEMHGFTAVELIDRKGAHDLVFPEDWPRVAERIGNELAGVPVSAEVEFRGVRKDGSIIDQESYGCLTDYEGRPAVIGTIVDVSERKKAEKELKEYRDRLEELVKERTLQLAELNRELQKDIARRKDVEKTLEIKSRNLVEVNTALKVLLRQREEDRIDLEERVSSNVKTLVFRYLSLLKETRLNDNQHGLVDIITSNLRDIISPFSQGVTAFDLTPKEMEVAAFIKDGKTTKQIAKLLNVSPDAVSRHRYNIRRKFGINKQRANLRGRLLSIR